MKVNIITDSTFDVTEEVKKQLKIIPLTLYFGDEEYIDGVTINHKQFYEKLVTSDVMPTTSQVPPDTFLSVFKEVAEKGESAVVLTISSSLSGTYQSAMIAAEEYPDNIFVVDSRTAALGSGILAELALKLVENGMSAKEIANVLTRERENICLIAMLDTLEYLKRGGRISKTVAFAGGLLSIKPVICIKDGEIQILGKARGSKQANNLLASEIEKAGGVDFNKPLLLGFTGLEDTLLSTYIEDSAHFWKNGTDKLNQTIIGSVIGTHAGPGAIGVAFFKKQ